MTNKGKKRQPFQKFSFVYELLRKCKWKVAFISAVIFVLILTGVVVAIKTRGEYAGLDSFGSLTLKEGGITANFFGSLFSVLIVVFICFGCSYLSYLLPIALVFLGYRGYLLGFNIALIFMFNGMTGIVVTTFIVIPCHFIILASVVLMYALLCKTRKDMFCYGGATVGRQRLKILLLTLAVIVFVCFVEVILLSIFSPTIILIL